MACESCANDGIAARRIVLEEEHRDKGIHDSFQYDELMLQSCFRCSEQTKG